MPRCGWRPLSGRAPDRTKCRRAALFATIAWTMPVDVNRLRTEHVYESRAPVSALVSDLAEIEALAVEWRAARKRLFVWGTCTLVVGLLLLFVFFPAGIVVAGIGVFLFFRAKAYPKSVANNLVRCTFGKSLAGMLELDAE